ASLVAPGGTDGVETAERCCNGGPGRDRAARAAPPALVRRALREPIVRALPGTVLSRALRTAVRDAIDDARLVVAQEQRAVRQLHETRRTPPRLAVLGDEADEKVDVLARRLAVLDRQPHDLMAGAVRAVPRAVEHDERVARVLVGKRGRARARRIEQEADGGGVRAERHVRRQRLAGEVRPLAGVARVLVVAHVVPRPAVEAAFLHAGRVVRDDLVAEPVALVDRAPDVAVT